MANETKNNPTPGMIKEGVNLANLARARQSVQAGIRQHIAQQQSAPQASTPPANTTPQATAPQQSAPPKTST